MSLQAIADELNASGIKPRRGNEWTRASLSVILHNTFYVGILTHGGKTIDGTHEPIISKVQFGKVQAILSRKHKGGNAHE